MGSTQRYTAKEVADALIQSNGIVVQAARKLGCTAKTVYNYADRYVTVEQAMKDGRAELYAFAQAALVNILKDKKHRKQTWAIDRVLEAFGPTVDDGVVWSEKMRLEHSGPNQEPIAHQWGPPEPEPEEIEYNHHDPEADA